MTPAGHAALLKVAKAAGFARLGDWLDTLTPGQIQDLNEMSEAERTTTFKGTCDNATKALNRLYDVIDYDPPMTKSSRESFQAMRRRYRDVVSLAKNVGTINL